jgi:hypothetical protein
MLQETRDALLYAQLQEGLRFDLIKDPAVSGASDYQTLCVAAKNEERRLAELQKRRHYSNQPNTGLKRTPNIDTRTPRPSPDIRGKKCWHCHQAEHIATNCPKPKAESPGRKGNAKMVSCHKTPPAYLTEEILKDPLSYLLSDLEDREVNQIRVKDRGSEPKRVKVIVGGVPTTGIVDTAADINIMGEIFKQVASTLKLQKRPTDKCPIITIADHSDWMGVYKLT